MNTRTSTTQQCLLPETCPTESECCLPGPSSGGVGRRWGSLQRQQAPLLFASKAPVGGEQVLGTRGWTDHALPPWPHQCPWHSELNVSPFLQYSEQAGAQEKAGLQALQVVPGQCLPRAEVSPAGLSAYCEG